MPANKEQIADAFARHVERFGYGKASVEDVAAELGISKRTVYQHFSSKRDIYAYVVDGFAAKERERVLAGLAGLRTYREQMERFLRMIVAGMRQHINETTKADWMQEFEVADEAMVRAYGSVGAEIVAKGAAAGEFEFDEPELASGLIGAMFIHYSQVVREDATYDVDEKLVAAIMRMLGGPVARGRQKGLKAEGAGALEAARGTRRGKE